MASVADEREVRRMNRQEPQTPEGKLVLDLSKVNEKRQWYKADGTPLPVLLPIDDYNRKVFQARGWTLVPPRPGGGQAPVPQAQGLSPIQQEIVRAKEKLAAKQQSQVEAKVKEEVPPTPATEEDFNFLPEATVAVPVPPALPVRPGSVATEAAPLYVKDTDKEVSTAVHKSMGDGQCECGWKSVATKKADRKKSLHWHIKEQA